MPVHQCKFCQYKTTDKSHLAKHILTHTREKPHTCPHCATSFSQKSNLTTHLRVHTDERPYPCDQCGKRFRQKISLKRHKGAQSCGKLYPCPSFNRHVRTKHRHISETNLHQSKASLHLQNTSDGVVTAITHTTAHGSTTVSTSYLSSSQGKARVQTVETHMVKTTTIEQSGPSGSNNPCSSSQSNEAAHYVAYGGAISAETPAGKIVSHSIKGSDIEDLSADLSFDNPSSILHYFDSRIEAYPSDFYLFDFGL